MQIRASAPGKIILHGEHAVVHGAPALAAAIDRRTFVTITPTPLADLCLLRVFGCEFALPYADLIQLSARFRSRNVDFIRSDQVTDDVQRFVGDHVQSDRSEDIISISVFAYLFAAITSQQPQSCLLQEAFEIAIDSELPVGAGLGSSASFCAATAAAILFATTRSALDCDFVNRFAFESERIVHGSPSGVDNMVVVGGGAVLYRVGAEPERLPAPFKQRVIVVDTMISRSTKQLVASVGDFQSRHPGLAKNIFDAIGEISLEAVAQFRTGKLTICPELIHINQLLLDAIGVGHVAINEICNLAQQQGIAAKLTGAGGGGCVICIVPAGCDPEPFIEQVRQAGFRALDTTFCSVGVEVQSVSSAVH